MYYPTHFFKISQIYQHISDLFKTESREYAVKFHNLEDLNLLEQLSPIFDEIVSQITSDISAGNIIGLQIQYRDAIIQIPFCQKAYLNGETIISAVEDSNEDFDLNDDTMIIHNYCQKVVFCNV